MKNRFLVILAFFASFNLAASPSYTIVVDPGHGGAIKRYPDDRYDPVKKKYLTGYLPGTAWKGYTEYKLVLDLGKSIDKYLKLTETEAGWKQFEAILKQFSDQKEFKRVRLRSVMTRTHSYSDRKVPVSSRRVNDPYRLYDYPVNGKMKPGRLSFVNAQDAHLVVSLHLNPAPKGHPGGMGAVLAPGYKTFDLLRQITLKQKSQWHFNKLPWVKGWLSTQPGWSKFQAARADAWVYFNGYWSKKDGSGPWYRKPRGFRHNLLTWNYSDGPGWVAKARKGGPGPYSMNYRTYKPVGKFWDRERAEPEYWRREAPVAGTRIKYGGDNHYASDELLRYIQYGVRTQVPARRPAGKMGGILDPFVSTYTLPTYTNAIVAFLEVGHLNVWRDRRMVIDQREEVARSIAVGIYSLFAGLDLKKRQWPYRPEGKPVNWTKYENWKGGNYFQLASP